MQIPFKLIVLVACVTISQSALGQLGSWTAHTSMQDVTGVAVAADQIWASSAGGVFYVERSSGSIGALTAVDGLHAVSARTITIDPPRSSVWVGYSDGVLDRIDTETGSIESFLDIARATRFSRRAINRIVSRGDSLFVCTDFGVVVFDPEMGEVRDAYTRLGSVPAGTGVNDVAFAADGDGVESIWVATDDGLAIAALNSVNLQDPLAWTVEALPVAVVRSIAYFAGRLYVGTDGGLFVRQAEAVFANLGVDAGAIPRLESTDGLLVGFTQFQVLVIDENETVSRFPIADAAFPSDIQLVGNELWVGTSGTGLVRVDVPPPGTQDPQAIRVAYLPEGPFSAIFSDLAASVDGTLWAGGVVGGTGFHRLNVDGTWTDYTGDYFDILEGRRSFTSVAADAVGTGWAASEGGGLAHVLPDGAVEIFDESNSTLRAATGFPGFIVVGGVAVEADGGVWATTRGSATPLHYRAPDGTWTGLPPLVGGGLTTGATAYADVFIDSFGQKWLILREESSFGLVKGLAVLDTGADPTDPSDDSFRFFGTKGGGGQGLPGKSVTSIVEDRDGLVWIGTQEGLAYFVNTGVTARDPSAVAIWPQRADRSEGTFLFLGLPVNDLAVDPANRLWIATNDGVRVVRSVEDGFEEVFRLTADSSPLLSDAVLAIEVVPDEGQVYFATDAGLVSVGIDAVSPSASVDDLFIYPNPVRLGESANSFVVVSGLVDRTEVSIVSAIGQVVATFTTRGGQSRWDLRDASGQPVPSGVYLVVAVAENGEGTAYGKVAVIN
ncbi:MAG: T9SS type A sorting domain-containing protein [Rhodothermales bacterium]|nr:T9SS type A sorting domain-containing protein [Rhodothermales bacterium]